MEQTVFQKTIKPRAVEEFLDYYFYRRVAALLVPGFARLNISPNAVTWMSLFSGVWAAILVYQQSFVSGFFLYLLSIILDCVDGQLARLTGKSDPIGRILDGLVDMVCVACLWVAICFNSYFSSDAYHLRLYFMIFSGASMLVHCYRYDNVKIKALELYETQYQEKDLDVQQALALAKQHALHYHLFNAVLALLIALQMYLFVRGNAPKKELTLSPGAREENRRILEPEISFWSWLGVGHHNSLVLLGVLLMPWTAWGLWLALFMIAGPMNLFFIWGEIRFKRIYAPLKTKYL